MVVLPRERTRRYVRDDWPRGPDIPTARPLRTHAELAQLVAAIVKASPTGETNWLEWKRTLDLSTKIAQGVIARTILGMANRTVATVMRSMGGCGYIVIGVEPGLVKGVTEVDPAQLVHTIQDYWDRTARPGKSPTSTRSELRRVGTKNKVTRLPSRACARVSACSIRSAMCGITRASLVPSRQIRMSDEACVRLRPGRFMARVEAGSVPTDLACRRWSFPSQVGGRMIWFVAETKRLLLASRAAAMRSWVTGRRGRLRPASGPNGTYQGGAVFSGGSRTGTSARSPSATVRRRGLVRAMGRAATGGHGEPERPNPHGYGGR
jgi:hypothetical protein